MTRRFENRTRKVCFPLQKNLFVPALDITSKEKIGPTKT